MWRGNHRGNHHPGLWLAGIALAMAVTMGNTSPALAQQPPPKNWGETKCANYKSAWVFTLARRPKTGLSQEFLDRHEAFLASGCSAQADVCPRSPEERDLANLMIILAMNAGTASTFPPFACRK
jgi:hypothetical protein